MSAKEIKVVFDTQVFLRALINPNSICGKLVFNMQPDYTLYTTEKINAEILEVLGRTSIRSKFPQITDEQVKLVEIVLGLSHLLEIKSEDIKPISRDPKDDIFLACAKAANADYLVSEDKVLLVLEEYAGVKIITALSFLAILEARGTVQSQPQDDTED